ncbi:hypothetical protein HDU76_011950 [Blyttiomyces sp. JEL0837]|nr:hypothetical protein HDU76_011950 [Blyttiomyces sp. JEL0837]
MKEFVVLFAQAHLDFRLAELRSLAEVENVPMEYEPDALQKNSPFMVIKLNCAEDAAKLLRRAILIREIVELWAHALTFQELLEKTKLAPQGQLDIYRKASFKFEVTAFGTTMPTPDQVARIEQFSFLPFEGEINLKNPDFIFSVYEDYKDYGSHGFPVPEVPEQLFFGRLVATGDRKLIKKYDLKKRDYLGITSMDAQLSLLMSNQGLVKEGSFVLDPFVGTGSFLFTSAHYGAFAMGSDIDGRQIRGRDGKSVTTTMKQYNLTGRIIGTVVCDIAHHSWRDVEFWDAIICDPPYGVRAGAKKIAVNPKYPPKTSHFKADGQPRLPQTVPYELDEVLLDLLDFAAKFLVPGGRLVYWLPTVPDIYTEEDVPRHRRMRLVANSEQFFGKWARRLITMEKLRSDEPDIDLSGWVYSNKASAAAALASAAQAEIASADSSTPSSPAPAHAKFREVYFSSTKNNA